MPYSGEDLIRAAVAAFPEIADDMIEYDGLLHVQVGVLAGLAQRAKGEGHWDNYQRCIDLVEHAWKDPEPSLLNALNVSFLEHLDFHGPRGDRAWRCLSPHLQRGWQDMQAYLRDLEKAPGKKK